ncbi:unnamed protein product, partial [Prorocentrum cordatum]
PGGRAPAPPGGATAGIGRAARRARGPPPRSMAVSLGLPSRTDLEAPEEKFLPAEPASAAKGARAWCRYCPRCCRRRPCEWAPRGPGPPRGLGGGRRAGRRERAGGLVLPAPGGDARARRRRRRRGVLHSVGDAPRKEAQCAAGDVHRPAGRDRPTGGGGGVLRRLQRGGERVQQPAGAARLQ